MGCNALPTGPTPTAVATSTPIITTENTAKYGRGEEPITIGLTLTAIGFLVNSQKVSTHKNIYKLAAQHSYGPPRNGNQFNLFLSMGIQSRVNPLTPKENQMLTRKLVPTMPQLLMIWARSTK